MKNLTSSLRSNRCRPRRSEQRGHYVRGAGVHYVRHRCPDAQAGGWFTTFGAHVVASLRGFAPWPGPRWRALVILWLATTGLALAQQSPAAKPPADTTRPREAGPPSGGRGATDSLATPYSTAVADSILMKRDSVFYTRLKQRMYKRRLTRQLYDAVFRDVYNSRRQTGEVNTIEVNPFEPFRGRIIGRIIIRRLDVFGQSVYDTTRRARNWFERTANRIHVDTREGIIRRSYLQFREGDEVDPVKLQDNERLLRTVNIFTDARILVVPREGSRQFVDVYVITQDVWSLLPLGDVGSLNQFSVGFEQRNVRGLGHQFYNQFWYNGNAPVQPMEYRARYIIPYIGKTFLTARADLLYLRDIKQQSVRLFRDFLTPETKYAGSIEFGNYRLRTRFFPTPDSVNTFNLAYTYSDVWLGRSFRTFFGNPRTQTRARLVVAARLTRFTFYDRPTVIRPDTNQLYQNTRTTLFSVGYSKRRYVRDVLIYGFGRTEDVPSGSMVSVVGGFDNAELGERVYAGINFSHGQYVKRMGYIYGMLSIGSFYRVQRLEQGILSLESNYFSPLLNTRWGNLRHFLNVRYTAGEGRFNNEFITLSGREGLGVNTDLLRGTTRLLIGNENVLFSRLNIIGFRVAFITSVNFGLITFGRSLLRSPVYQSYGIGFRLRNENLTFNSFQFRLAWYPNVPQLFMPLRMAFEGIPVLRFRDFDISAPAIIPYR